MKPILIVLALTFLIPAAYAGDEAHVIQIMTENLPPFNYEEDNQTKGICVDIVRAVLHKINHPDNIKVLPWSRAYIYIQEYDNHALFSTVRTKVRENQFKWVGPLLTSSSAFFAKKGSGIIIKKPEDAKRVGSVGVIKDYADYFYFKSLGFQNLNVVVEYKSHLQLKKLINNRLNIFVTNEIAGKYLAIKNHIDLQQIEIVYRLEPREAYIAFSKKTNKQIINTWQNALDEFKQGDAYKTIIRKYESAISE